MTVYRNVAEEAGGLALRAWGDTLLRNIHEALDRFSCPECGGWDGMHDVTVVLGWGIDDDVTLYVNELEYPGSVFATCSICNPNGVLPDNFTEREANNA